MNTHVHSNRNALVVGASGTAGSAIVRALSAAAGWSIATLHRRPVDPSAIDDPHNLMQPIRALHADLLDRNSLRATISPLTGITHVFYSARLNAPTLQDEIGCNVEALHNLMDELHIAGNPIERVILMEGSKWYGSHLGRYLVPALETDRSTTPYYYHAQQALLERLATTAQISWSALRPHTVLGFALNPQHNLLFLMALYAAVCAHQGQSMSFPGTPERYMLPTTATNSETLSNAALWAATADTANNQAFNINNGDMLKWEALWPEVCSFFSLKPGVATGVKLSATMPAYERLWNDIKKKQNLVGTRWPSAKEWAYADGILSPARVDIIDTSKIRQAGFDCSADTPKSIIAILHRFREARLIP